MDPTQTLRRVERALASQAILTALRNRINRVINFVARRFASGGFKFIFDLQLTIGLSPGKPMVSVLPSADKVTALGTITS